MLYLSNNQLSILPNNIIKLQKLTYLFFDFNKFKIFPLEILKISTLKYINCKNNNFLIQLPDYLYITKQLYKLQLFTFDFDMNITQIKNNPLPYKSIADNWIFTHENPRYNHSPKILSNENNNPYIIHYETFNGYEYPIVTLPKGTMLYTYAFFDNNNNNNKLNYNLGKAFLYNTTVPTYNTNTNSKNTNSKNTNNTNTNSKNINSKNTNSKNTNSKNTNSKNTNNNNKYNFYDLSQYVETDFKFFNPIPYAEEGIVGRTYNYCNIVVLTEDIRIMALLVPAPHNKNNMSNPFINPVLNLKMPDDNYYNNNYTYPGHFNIHNLRIQPEMMKFMNIQGYIGLDKMDNISHGTMWGDILNNIKNNKDKDILRELVLKSCIDSNYATTKNNNVLINKVLDININVNNCFGIPEIVLCPLKSQYFLTEFKRDDIYPLINTNNYSKFNYQPLAIIENENIKDTLNSISTDIIQNMQSPLLSIYKPIMNTNYKYTYSHIINVNDYTNQMVDYIHTYKYPNEPIIGGIFKINLFDILNIKTKTKTQTKTRKIYGGSDSIQKSLINNNQKENIEVPKLEITKSHIPILYW